MKKYLAVSTGLLAVAVVATAWVLLVVTTQMDTVTANERHLDPTSEDFTGLRVVS